jgi:hypothetical protein
MDSTLIFGRQSQSWTACQRQGMNTPCGFETVDPEIRGRSLTVPTGEMAFFNREKDDYVVSFSKNIGNSIATDGDKYRQHVMVLVANPSD